MKDWQLSEVISATRGCLSALLIRASVDAGIVPRQLKKDTCRCSVVCVINYVIALVKE